MNEEITNRVVAWLIVYQPNVLQKVKQKHFFGIELQLFYNAVKVLIFKETKFLRKKFISDIFKL